MSYTRIEDERMDNEIDQEPKIVCDEILKVVKPVSIILFGGYGRGKESAFICLPDLRIRTWELDERAGQGD